MCSRPLDNRDGFTLLEVLVALVVLTLAVVFLNRAISDSLMRAERIDTEDRAIIIADSTLSRLGNDVPLRMGVTEGEQGSLLWRISVTPKPAPNNIIPLDQIDLSVFNKSGHILGHWQTLRVSAQTP